MVKIKIFKGYSNDTDLVHFEKEINEFLKELYIKYVEETSIYVDVMRMNESELICCIQWTEE